MMWCAKRHPDKIGKISESGALYVDNDLWNKEGLVQCPRCDHIGIEAYGMYFYCWNCGNLF
jgi:hypothetical protein